MRVFEEIRNNYVISNGEFKSYEKKIIENINASQNIRCNINKEQDPFKMLDLSLLCISIMTGDSEFYNQNKDKLINIICNWNIISKNNL